MVENLLLPRGFLVVLAHLEAGLGHLLALLLLPLELGYHHSLIGKLLQLWGSTFELAPYTIISDTRCIRQEGLLSVFFMAFQLG